MDLVKDLLIDFGTAFGDKINLSGRTIMRAACKFYNMLVEKACDLFTMTPWDFTGGQESDTWQLVNTCNTVFVSIASTLLCIFWLIGFLQETTDARQEIRVEQVIRFYVKICVAEGFVVSSFPLVCWFFTAAISLASSITGTNVNLTMNYSTDLKPTLELLNSSVNPNAVGLGSMLYNLLLWIAGIIMFGIFLAIGISIFMAAIKRFLKILIIIPYGSLAASTLAGSPGIRRTAEGFYRYAIASAFEVVTMILMIAIGTSLMGNNDFFQNVLGNVPTSATDLGDTFIYIMGVIVIKAIMLGCVATGVKQSEQITQRIIG